MGIQVELDSSTEKRTWDSYVSSQPRSTLYQYAGWLKIIEKSYGHESLYLEASLPDNRVVGVLPLIRMRKMNLKKVLVSVPFFDYSGILADNSDAEKALILKAVEAGRNMGCGYIELRHTLPLQCMANGNPLNISVASHKVRMAMEIPGSPAALMKSFKSKLRSQIKKPLKEGFYSVIGGAELLEDFYDVFCHNMRDLGSPVHSVKIIENVLEEYPSEARIVMVYRKKEPAACAFIIGFKETLGNPWASSLRRFSRFSPNMLLYWTMLEYACGKGYRYFDFGRSTPGEGTYRFKKQWGATPMPLYWYCIDLRGREGKGEGEDSLSKYRNAVEYWRKMPVKLTRILGPVIRKYIEL